MESNEQFSPRENVDVKAKATFRKPANDAGNRKYRRRSPVNGSSSPEGKVLEKKLCSISFTV